MMRLVRVIVLALSPAFLCAPALLAQTEPDPPLGTGQLSIMRMPLQPVQSTPELLTHWGSEAHWSFAPFDEARFGFRSVTLTLDRPSDCTDGQRVLVDVIVTLEGSAGTRYWRLSEPVNPAASDFCDLGDPDRWGVMQMDEGQARPGATRATPDPGMPIFRVEYSAAWPDRTSVGNTQQLVIDARNLIPMAPARVTVATIDGFCINPPELPDASCRWDGAGSDFLCTESFHGGKRYSWMTSGQRLAAPPASREPATLAAFVTTLLAAPNAIGRWAEPHDVGAVRMIAEVPSRTAGRRILVFGASGSFQSPFVIAMRDGDRTRVVPVPLAGGTGPLPDLLQDTSVPIGEFRPSGEPPVFTVQTMSENRPGTRLLRVVAESKDFRTLYHVAIDEAAAEVVAGAIHVASSLKTPEDAFDALTSSEHDACAVSVGGFSSPANVRLAPLAITYDVEPSFDLGNSGPERDGGEMCVVSSRATWTAGKGFTLTYQPASCSIDRFREAYVRPNGSLDIHTYRPAP